MSIRSKTIIAGFVLLSSLTMLGACGGGTESSRGFVKFDGMKREFETSMKKFSWPKGYKVPMDWVDGEANSGITYQSGWGDTVASHLYMCAWEKEWLNTYATDIARAEYALQVLQKIPQMGFMQEPRADKRIPEIFIEYYNKAKLGDPSGFQQDVKANCA